MADCKMVSASLSLFPSLFRRSTAPGLRDLLVLGPASMAGGVAPNGNRVLSAESVQAMHSMTVACPKGMNIDAIGLATFMWDWNGDGTYEVFGHDGSTIGQAAWARYHPASGTGFWPCRIPAMIRPGGR